MKNTSLFVGTLLTLCISTLGFAETKIGIVDINRILANSVQFKNMQADLKAKFAPRTQEIIDLQNSFLKDIKQYKKNSVSIKGEACKKEQQKLVDENKKLQETQSSLQRDIVTAQNQALQPIMKQIETIVNRIAQEQGFDLIVTKINTAYNSDSQTEITIQVIAEMGKLA